MKLEEGAKVRGCQCSVLVLLHPHVWCEAPLLLPSLPVHLLRPAPYRHPALERKSWLTLARVERLIPAPWASWEWLAVRGVVGRHKREESGQCDC